MTTLPGKTGPGVSSLGGIDLGVSAYSKHQKTAKDFVAWMQSPSSQKILVSVMNQASVLQSLYSDPALVKVSPYLPELKDSLLGANPRPKTANYNAVTPGDPAERVRRIAGQGHGRPGDHEDGGRSQTGHPVERSRNLQPGKASRVHRSR